MTHAADVNQRPLVTEVLDDASRLNLTVIRCWAFCDGTDEWNALHPEPGKFNETVLVGLDWLVQEAGRRGIRLLLALTNYWADYGGMPAYVRWRYGILDRTQHDYEKHPTSLFYTDPHCQAIFRRAVSTVVNRINSLTGVPYTQEPAILGWELANEPRCEGPDGNQVLQHWVASTADFVRELDPNHLITVGLEGFFGPSTPELMAHNPYESAARHGADFAAIFAHPSLDFASIHLYPDQWCPLDSSPMQLMSFMRTWIQGHATLCGEARLRKPLVLSEFGKRDPNSYHGRDCVYDVNRAAAFQEVLDCCRELALSGGPLVGVCAWLLAAKQYPDYDGYTLKLGTAVVPAPLGPERETEGELQPVVESRNTEGGRGATTRIAEGCQACNMGPFRGTDAAGTPMYPLPDKEELAVRLLRQYGEDMSQLCVHAAGMETGRGDWESGQRMAVAAQLGGGGAAEPAAGLNGGSGFLSEWLARCCGLPRKGSAGPP
ncbi:hypothetical protein Vretifemale_13826 [Volvox reticuliferus]|nr:hypothetical protein Vretifemale_13826 [Volvox reticuliferus]